MSFYDTPSVHGWSSFRPELRDHYRSQGITVAEIPIPVTTLTKICEEYVEGTIDFLKIDAEGYEREILLGADFRRWRPRVLVIENAWPETWESLLDGTGYLSAAFDGLNRFYVREEDNALLPRFAATANILDNFIPYEYLRLLQLLSDKKSNAIADMTHRVRHDAHRLYRKIRRSIGSLKSRIG